jgi:putative hydrolase of the HAD superfamily
VKISVLFTDIGGVLLTNGWDRNERRLAAKEFNLNPDELNDRHNLTFDTFEIGKITLKEYLDRTVFYTKRSFTAESFKKFMFRQSAPYEDIIELYLKLKEKYKIRIIAVNNESRELNDFRVQKFGLHKFIDVFVSSCYIHFRKPDKDIYKAALDIAQVNPNEAVFIDDRPLFVEVAEKLGIHGIHHKDYESTVKKFTRLGLDPGK